MPPEAFDLLYRPTRASDIYRYDGAEPPLNVIVLLTIQRIFTATNLSNNNRAFVVQLNLYAVL